MKTRQFPVNKHNTILQRRNSADIALIIVYLMFQTSVTIDGDDRAVYYKFNSHGVSSLIR